MQSEGEIQNCNSLTETILSPVCEVDPPPPHPPWGCEKWTVMSGKVPEQGGRARWRIEEKDREGMKVKLL